MASESAIQARVRRHLEREGWLMWKNHGSAFSEVGLPDLMGLKDGNFIGIEMKKPGGAPTKKQLRWLEKIRSRGGSGAVIDNMEDLKAFLRETGLE